MAKMRLLLASLAKQGSLIAAIDLFVLPTIAFQILYCLVIVRHGRRLWVSFGVTANPTAEWISREVTEAFPWDHAPRYLIRDRDTSYGPVFLQRIRAMGIRDHPIAPRSPWQNAYVERPLQAADTLRQPAPATGRDPDCPAEGREAALGRAQDPRTAGASARWRYQGSRQKHHPCGARPPRTGRETTAPRRSIARWRGASLFRDRWVLDTL